MEARVSLLTHFLPVKWYADDPLLVPHTSWTGHAYPWYSTGSAPGRGKDPMVMPDWGGAEKLVNPKRLASQVRALTGALGRSEGQLHSGYVRARR